VTGFDPSRIGARFGPHSFLSSGDRAALYALACGATEQELDLLLESRGPRVLPTYCVLAAWPAVIDALSALGGDLVTVVHGSQRCWLERPLPPDGEWRTEAQLTALYDKGKAALVVVRTETADDDGRLASTEWQLVYRGQGGFGGDRGPEPPDLEPPPQSPPDAARAESTLPTQALLYRLVSGDKNPIHAEPAIAEALGFPRPILHGLCTMGFATRALAHLVAEGRFDRIQSIEGRFAQPVLPGDAIETAVWSTDRGSLFRCTVPERDTAVLTLGRVTTFPTSA
jgi:acyl dehydratase